MPPFLWGFEKVSALMVYCSWYRYSKLPIVQVFYKNTGIKIE
jgi:hypothetical protein